MTTTGDDPGSSSGDDAGSTAGADPELTTEGPVPDPDETISAGPAAPRPAFVDPLVPHAIGPYRIVKRLGQGGMGIVYLAEDPTLGRRIAIKVLSDRNVVPDALARFEEEARLLAAINHPNIATVHTLEVNDGVRFLTMEFVEGPTLEDRVREGPIAIDLALAIARQITQAIEAAHAKGIIHQDLKPGNIMLAADDVVKVLDFGLARSLKTSSTESSEAADRPRLSSGTPGYMSPEQIHGEDVDRRADIWAFGCVLYECLSGRRAFSGETVHDRLRAALIEEPDWNALSPETPATVRAVLPRCLEKNPAHRPETITELRRVLEDEIALRLARRVSERVRREKAPAAGNLPLQTTSFVGRGRQKADVLHLLDEGRLVTLTGMGGCGKTRLAIEVAREQQTATEDGVWMVELAPLSDPSLVAKAATTALGLPENPGRTPEETLIAHLADRSPVLVIDNCEHLIESTARLVDGILRRTTGVRILATSREHLGVPGEAVYHVPPLATVRNGDRLTLRELAAIEAVELFVERSHMVDPAFELTQTNASAVQAICRQLDGIPLALELAAARTTALPVDEIARRLDDRFRFLTRGSRTALPHHQTLRALIDWSHDLLGTGERTLFRRLAVFAGGMTLESVEAVGAGDGVEEWEVLDLLTQLVDKSLVERDLERGEISGQPRYRMLEMVRQYARDRLKESGEERLCLERHARFFVSLAERAEPLLTTREQARWLSRLETDHDNLRAAAATLAEPDGDATTALRLAGALGLYWQIRGHWTEGRRSCADILARPGAQERTRYRAKVLNWAGNLARVAGEYALATALHEESLSIRREVGDQAGTAASLNNLALVAKRRGRLREAARWLEEGLAIRRALGDRMGTATTLVNLGLVTIEEGHLDRAGALFRESLAALRELGDRRGEALALHNLGVIANERRQLDEARSDFEESLVIRRELGDRAGVAATLGALGVVAERMKDLDRAAAFLDESLNICREMSDRLGTAIALTHLGDLAVRVEEYDRAEKLHREALSIASELGDRLRVAAAHMSLGTAARLRGDPASARVHLRQSLELWRQLGDRPHLARCLSRLGCLEAVSGEEMRAARVLGAAWALCETLGLPARDFPEMTEGIETLRRRLGDAFEASWAEGRALPVDRAIEIALMEEGDELP